MTYEQALKMPLNNQELILICFWKLEKIMLMKHHIIET